MLSPVTRISRSALVCSVVAAILILLGVWMIVTGWPMSTPVEVLLMDLAQLPMSAAVGVGIVQLTWSRRMWIRSPKAFWTIFTPAAIATGIGLVLLVIGVLGPRGLVGPAQVLIWIGVGLAFTYLAVDSLRREVNEARPFLMSRVSDDSDDGIDDRWSTEDDEGPATGR